MAVATEVTSVYAQTPASQPARGMAGSIDRNLILRESAAVTADGNTTAIDVEGGSMAEWAIRIGAVTGTSPTMTLWLQVSKDGGSTYTDLIGTPSLDTNDANQPLARLVYLPRPTGTNKLLKVRTRADAGGTTPSFTLVEFLRPPGFGSDSGLEYTT
jgi:hypothetical protein